jgi:hypothetical protein
MFQDEKLQELERRLHAILFVSHDGEPMKIGPLKDDKPMPSMEVRRSKEELASLALHLMNKAHQNLFGPLVPKAQRLLEETAYKLADMALSL